MKYKIFLVSLFITFNISAKLKFNADLELHDFADVLQDAEALINRQESDRVTRLCHMIRGIGKITKEASKVDLSQEDKQAVLDKLDLFKDKIKKSDNDLDGDDCPEQKKMSSGLAIIIHNVVSMMVNPKKLGTYLMNILSGFGKILSSILADGKINNDDWRRLMRAFGGLFSIKNLVGLLSAGKSIKRRALPAVY